MKTLKTLLVLLLFLYPPILAQSQVQEIKTVNKWNGSGDSRTFTDFVNTRAYFSNNFNSVIFADYGNTTYPQYWNRQGNWLKDFSPDFLDVFTTPDTVFFDCRLFLGIPMEKIKSVEVFISLQGSNRWYFIGSQSQYIPLNGSWKRLYWDMKKVKDFGLTSFYRLYLAFAVHTTDSCYVGVEVEADVLGGLYNNPKRTIVYDGFGNITDVPRGNSLPSNFVLRQNYPNPFNPSTKIKFSIPESGNYTLKVYNLLGQEIETLIDAYLAPGIQEYSFDGTNLPSGTYFYRLTGNCISLSNKMMLVK
jgi:hypothetical protein